MPAPQAAAAAVPGVCRLGLRPREKAPKKRRRSRGKTATQRDCDRYRTGSQGVAGRDRTRPVPESLALPDRSTMRSPAMRRGRLSDADVLALCFPGRGESALDAQRKCKASAVNNTCNAWQYNASGSARHRKRARRIRCLTPRPFRAPLHAAAGLPALAPNTNCRSIRWSGAKSTC